MDLQLTDDQRLIRQQAARLLADRAGPQQLRQTVAAATGFDAALWRTVARQLGWCAMTIAERHGGLGLSLTELSLVVEAAGERLAPLPLWSTACAAAPLLSAVATEEARAAILPRIAAGEIAATVAWGDLGAADPLAATPVTAVPANGGYLLDGLVTQVVDAEAADLVLVPARLAQGLALFALERGAGHETRQIETLDATRQIGALEMRGLRLSADARLDADGFTPRAAASAIATANLGLAAEQVGAARAVMDLTLAYVGERVQFGRVIASFQAVKHRCARLEVDLAEARAMVLGAAANFANAEDDERLLEARAARALASDLLFRAAEESIQLHGGVGFTWEYDPHLYLKRAQAVSALLGSADRHLEAIAEHLLAEACHER
ncbi:MAG: acyl-CoA dehydrogenase [Alphaproteobacteria bacterium]|nr:MAG: acyl-CoA dehydrogenase [Alphaproteobacteria bacterium]